MCQQVIKTGCKAGLINFLKHDKMYFKPYYEQQTEGGSSCKLATGRPQYRVLNRDNPLACNKLCSRESVILQYLMYIQVRVHFNINKN